MKALEPRGALRAWIGRRALRAWENGGAFDRKRGSLSEKLARWGLGGGPKAPIPPKFARTGLLAPLRALPAPIQPETSDRD